MSDLKQWAAVKGDVVVHGFDAPQELIDNFKSNIVDPAHVTTPPWYDSTVEFLDVTGLDPRPWDGYYRTADGTWHNGNPTLTASRDSIPADGNTPAFVIFAQSGPAAPAQVTFVVNGQEVAEPLSNGKATVEVVSVNPGDTVTVSVGKRSVVIAVEA